MGVLTIILIALGLAMDAFAVSLASGVMLKTAKVRNALKMAFALGIFQVIMPVTGWFAGDRFKGVISGVDHYVAFGLLALVGCHMIYGAVKERKREEAASPFDNHVLLMLAIATSIDALAVGISFAFLKVSIAAPVVAIGVPDEPIPPVALNSRPPPITPLFWIVPPPLTILEAPPLIVT